MSTPALTSPAASPAPARRPSRLEGRIGVPRAFGAFLVIVCLLAFLLYVGAARDPLARLVVAAIAVVGAMAGTRSMASGRWRGFALALLSAAAVLVMAHWPIGDLSEQGIAPLLLFGMDAFAMGTVAGVALCAVRLLSPLKSGLLTFSTATAILVGAVSLELKRADREATHLPSAQTTRAGESSSPLLPLSIEESEVFAPSNALVWAGPAVRHLPGVEYAYQPNIRLKTFYPDNPRGYFQVEEVYGPYDMRMTSYTVREPAQAQISWPSDPQGSVRIEPKKLDPKSPWKIGVSMTEIPLIKDHLFQLSFKARSDSARSIWLTSLNPLNDYSNLGLQKSLRLSEEWSEFSLEFSPTESTKSGTITLQLGQELSAVEIAAFAIAPAGATLSMTPEMFELVETPNNSGAFVSTNNTVRVIPSAVDMSAPWKLGVSGSLQPMKKGDTYEIRFRAKADDARGATVLIADAAPPYDNVGYYSDVTLDKEWRQFGAHFEARFDCAAPKLRLAVGMSDIPVEFANIQLQRLSDVARVTPKRFAVSYQMSADGFRDRNHSTLKPSGTFRIACLGDSYTFGQGVHEEDTFVRQIETTLQRQDGALQYETMNFGVCGYCTRQERIAYEKFVSKYKPDLVLVTMVFNDNLSYKEEQELKMQAPSSGGIQLFRQVQDQFRTTYDDVGYEVCVRELKALRELCRNDNARLAVAIYNVPAKENETSNRRMEQTILTGLKDTDIPVLTLGDSLQYMPFAVQAVHAVDGHPNALSHRVAAEAIVEFLHTHHLLDSPGQSPMATSMTDR